MTDKKLKELSLTGDQLKAAKAVYAAIKKAKRLGVAFWDNYGTLQAFNSKKITLPVPDYVSKQSYRLDDFDPTYYEELPGAFYSGNADDPLYYEEV